MTKQTVTVELEVPEGWRVVGFRPPKKGEQILTWGGPDQQPTISGELYFYDSIIPYMVVEKEKPSLKVGEVLLDDKTELLLLAIQPMGIQTVVLDTGKPAWYGNQSYIFPSLKPTGLTPEQFYKAKFTATPCK